MSHSMLDHQVTCHQPTESPGRSCYEHRAFGIYRARHTQDVLADMLSLAHVPEGLPRVSCAPHGDRRRRQHSAFKKPKQLPEDLPQPVRSSLHQIERAIVDTLVLSRDLLAVTYVGLTHLEETTAAGQQLERAIDELTRERIQHNIHASPTGCSKQLVGEIERPR